MPKNLEPENLKTPFYLVDEERLVKNLEILKDVSARAGCKILLAQKAFSMFSLYPLIGQYLDGTAASGLFELKLGCEEMPGGEAHIFSAAYRPDEMDEILKLCGHIVFNSFSEWERYKTKVKLSGKSAGIRLNPEFSTQEHTVYDPCAQNSRLGVTEKNFRPDLLDGIGGFHFHTLCEQDSKPLIDTLAVVERKFGRYFDKIEWINFGGGHHITREGYDVDALVSCICRFKEKYGLKVYLEPGEAIALDAGTLVSSVLDIVENGEKTAVIDASAACHMPDVLEMPYRPRVFGAGEAGEKQHRYILAGATCLAGDVVGKYSFDQPLKAGDRVVFADMAIYTMVKNNTFNGMGLPAIALRRKSGETEVVKKFSYRDFKTRLS